MLYKFREAVDIISGGTPKTSVPEYWNGDIGWLSVVDFVDKNKYVESTEKTITQEGVDNSSTKVLQINDIIISARGTVGAMAMLKKPLAFNQSCFGLRGKPEIINQDYLFYYLKNYMKVLKAKTQGSVFDTINLATFDLIDLNLPTLDEQERIAHILAAIDNKIDANQAINSELESLAKTIYDYWFLQFEFPNEEGKPYKSSGGRMVWNDELKREIPEGWETKSLSEIVIENEKSKTQVGDVSGVGDYPFFTSGESILKSNKHIVDGMNCYLSTGGNATLNFFDGKADYSTDTWCISASNDYKYMLYMYLKSILPMIDIKFFHGTGLKHLQKPLLLKETVIIPSNSILNKFNNMVGPSFKTVSKKYKENQELASLRDFLLPMLMNGQVTFKNN